MNEQQMCEQVRALHKELSAKVAVGYTDTFEWFVIETIYESFAREKTLRDALKAIAEERGNPSFIAQEALAAASEAKP